MQILKQKFKRGDLVHIAKDLGSAMDHFEKDMDAIVMGSYNDKYGGGNIDDYTLMLLPHGGECSWYCGSQLTLIKHVGEKGIAKVKEDHDKQVKIQQDIHWILKNWPTIRKAPTGATLWKLMELCGIDNPWGTRGEGYTLMRNQMATMNFLDSTLMTGDIKKLNKRLATLKEHQKNNTVNEMKL